MNKYLDKCRLCPRNCSVNRNNNEVGFCMATNALKLAKAYLHKWEEPCISGNVGSGTIFFSYCNLKCIYCQNYDISTLNNGELVSINRLKEICLELQDKGALNINLVTPTHYVPLIVEALKLAKKEGLNIPIVYNTSSYENVDTIKMLNGIVDVYLPDLKYYDDSYAIKYSNTKNYFKYASMAIDEMYKQVGKCTFDKDGIIKKGVIVRHLMLPKHIEDSKKVIEYLYNKYKNNIYISIMNQYTPLRKLEYKSLNEKVTDLEYNNLIDYAYDLGIRNAFVQEGETQKESFIPLFDGEGIIKKSNIN